MKPFLVCVEGQLLLGRTSFEEKDARFSILFLFLLLPLSRQQNLLFLSVFWARDVPVRTKSAASRTNAVTTPSSRSFSPPFLLLFHFTLYTRTHHRRSFFRFPPFLPPFSLLSPDEPYSTFGLLSSPLLPPRPCLAFTSSLKRGTTAEEEKKRSVSLFPPDGLF